MEVSPHVRIAGPQDAQGLLWHCYELFKDNYMGLPFSATRTMETVQGCCSGVGGIAGIIDGDDGFPIGSIGIVATQPNYSDVWILSESWCFVRPEFRKGNRYGQDLFGFAQEYRKHMAAQVGYDIPLEMSVFSFKKLKAKERFWGRYGKHVGAMFWVGAPEENPERRKVN